MSLTTPTRSSFVAPLAVRAPLLGSIAGVAALGLVGLALPSPASACGGFFCSSQPIDQSGENIVFSIEEDGSIEAHVQILYQGPSEEFAWILPTPSAPSISVGTDTLFQQLDQATRPQFQTTYEQTGTCRAEPECRYSDYDRSYPPSFAGGFTSDAGAAVDAAPRVDVVFHGNVGPYDAAVLSATDVDALYTWLNDFHYLIPESARPEIDQYIANGSYFVALRLQKDRATGEIQPIVLHYTNGEPCIPLRLTKIASVDDMPIRAYFLGSTAMRSTNYTMLTPDLTDDEGLFLGTRSYDSVVTNAVDDAGGRAFVTDYLGATPTVSLEIASLEDLRTTTDVKMFLAQLQSRGFVGDSQLLSLLGRFIPPPEGAEPTNFFNCLVNSWCSEHDAYLLALGFRPSEFVDALNEAIVMPRAHAQALVARHPKLTRLYTTMSAADMTEDPVFYPSPAAREVSNVHTARMITECAPQYLAYQAPQKLVLPSGREIRTREGIVYSGSDESFCGARGAIPLHRESRFSGLCSASSGMTGGAGGALAFAAMTVVAAVLRRRRRAA